LLESILIAAGYQVGVYSTPHLTHYNERVRLNGKPVKDSVLTEAFTNIDRAREDISLSYFEFGTLAALTIFAKQNVDVQILEVGLGGRLDAVNIVDADAVIISSISVDHIDWLGDDISKIALEKAGVFRSKQYVVCGDSSVPQSLLDYAAKLDTYFTLAGKDYSISLDEDKWCLSADHHLAGNYPFPALNGAHQVQNSAAVITLLAKLSNRLPLTKQNIDDGLKHVQLVGRLQQVNTQPDVFLDVAHNAESADMLAKFIQSKPYKGKLHAVFSILADKQIEQVVTPFLDRVDQWHIAPLDVGRAESIESLVGLCDEKSLQYSQYASIQRAFVDTVATAGKEDIVICFGSFYVVEACLDAL